MRKGGNLKRWAALALALALWLAACADGEQSGGQGDAGTESPGDSGVKPDSGWLGDGAVEVVCPPNTPLLCDGDTLVRCNESGDGVVRIVCEQGCDADLRQCL